ncbi:hypothetical protein [Sedimentibacter sp.]|uniref:hypothetical protein n=1 Tax=Sedimentibacter sp. TaxID=1960295 RepID=UPI0028A783BE|nr:hypothetical protein [Sedimentibacter sp.]
MKQYCRYCANAVLIDDDIAYCEVKHHQRPKRLCVTPNKCKSFLFNEMDVFDIEKKYQPMKIKKSAGNQIRMEV